MRYIFLGVSLFTFWLALSGHYTPFLIGAGASCSLLCVLVGARMRVVDTEGQPLQLLARVATYHPWLVWEIAKSSWAVAKLILHPKLPISPTMTVVTASQRSPAGIATYANSVTLTPGTLTTRVKGKHLTVHALTREGALDLEGGAMDARVKRFEGGE